MDIYELVKQVNEWVKEILQDNYVGVYFHGSLRLGSFNPNKSDLDFIIVVKEKINSETKQFIWDKMLENEQLFPKKGFEFSVVLEDNCRNIKHPIPYELHGSRDWIERYKEDKTIVINDDYKVDPDLASHFNVKMFQMIRWILVSHQKKCFQKYQRNTLLIPIILIH